MKALNLSPAFRGTQPQTSFKETSEIAEEILVLLLRTWAQISPWLLDVVLVPLCSLVLSKPYPACMYICMYVSWITTTNLFSFLNYRIACNRNRTLPLLESLFSAVRHSASIRRGNINSHERLFNDCIHPVIQNTLGHAYISLLASSHTPTLYDATGPSRMTRTIYCRRIVLASLCEFWFR